MGRAHTHESPRDVLLKHATDAALICRRWNDEERARLWDLEAAKLAGTIDSPAEMHRGLADIYESGGALNVAAQHRAVADSMDRFNAAFEDAERTVKAFPAEVEKIRAALVEDPEVAALHEPQGPPIDGREVDRAPEENRQKHDGAASPHNPWGNHDCWCLSDDVETERHWARTPETGGGSVPSPEADPPFTTPRRRAEP